MYDVYWLAIKFVLWLLQQNLNTLSQEMVKRGVVADHDNDEWESIQACHRSMRRQFWVLNNSCSELSISRPTMTTKVSGQGSVLTSHVKGGGGRQDGQRRHLLSPSWVLHLQEGYSCTELGLQSIHKFNITILWLGKIIKMSLYFPSDTIIQMFT